MIQDKVGIFEAKSSNNGTRNVILNGSRIDKNGFGKKNMDVIKLQIIAGKSVSLSVSKTARLISRN